MFSCAEARLSALVRAVEVSGEAANFAEPRFTRGEHFNRKGSQTALAPFGKSRFGASFAVLARNNILPTYRRQKARTEARAFAVIDSESSQNFAA